MKTFRYKDSRTTIIQKHRAIVDQEDIDRRRKLNNSTKVLDGKLEVKVIKYKEIEYDTIHKDVKVVMRKPIVRLVKIK